jgi:outer membrane protein OmpA-like peptidoglycan-associated protein
MQSITMAGALAGALLAGGGVARAQSEPEAWGTKGKIVCVPNAERQPVAGRECRAVRVHFGFDSSDLDQNSKTILRQSADCLKSQPTEKVTVSGAADKIGTEQYNLALGHRRAASVATFLESQGVGAGQINKVSIGKQLPLCMSKTEECNAINRRVTLMPTSRLERLRTPEQQPSGQQQQPEQQPPTQPPQAQPPME